MNEFKKNKKYNFENNYEFTHFGAGFGKRFEHQLYEEYREKIDGNLVIIRSFNEKVEKDVIDTLKKSLENGLDFYSNANEYIKKEMQEYNFLLNSGVLF